MIINDTITGIAAIVIAYLLGSIPAAYIVTRLITGKDIRKVGGGNVGARNVFREVGKAAGIGVGIFDMAKGVAAVFIALRLLGAPTVTLVDAPQTYQIFILAAGLAAVVGHIWPVYIKFNGGNGLATSIGVLSIVMTWELLLALALVVLLVVFTRNPVLSLNISLLSVPVTASLLGKPWIFVVFAIVLLLILIINFIPTARAALVKAGGGENLFADLFRRKRASKKKRR